MKSKFCLAHQNIPFSIVRYKITQKDTIIHLKN